jgi:hypothetical protein
MIPESSLTSVLQRTLTALDIVFSDELSWPSDHYLDDRARKFASILGDQFANLVAVVDGTEIRINRPSDQHFQKEVYSVKKKQHSITLLLISTIDGILLYASDPLIGANDQRHWNALQLHKLFENKSYGIVGDSAFTFNSKRSQKNTEPNDIIGFTPYRKPKKGQLSKEQKEYNRHLSSLRVVIENVIAQLKKWRILKGTYRHFSLIRNNQIDFSLATRVLTVIVARSLRKRSLRCSNWGYPTSNSSDWSSDLEEQKETSRIL